MKRKIITTLLLVGSFVVCLAAITGISGKWSATLKPGDGSGVPVTYTFNADGDKFTGSLAFPNNTIFPITDGVIKGDSISFKVTLNNKGIPNYGKVYADSIGLDIVMMGKKFHNTLTRADK